MSSIANLTAELAKLGQQEQELIAEGRVLHASLGALRTRLHEHTVATLDQRTAAVEALVPHADPQATLSWQHAFWETYAGNSSDLLVTHARIGLHNNQGPIAGEREAGDIPCLVPLLHAKGALVFKCNNKTQERVRDAIRSLVLRLAVCMPGSAMFSLIDPIGLGAAFPFENSLPRVRPTARSVSDALQVILDDIQRINQRVVGAEENFLSLSNEARSGEHFELTVLADFPKAYAREPRALEQLQKIANSGARAGRHLIIEYNIDEPLPRDFSLEQLTHAHIVDGTGNSILFDRPPSGNDTRHLIEQAAATGRHRNRSDFNTLVWPGELMRENSARRIETPVGERLRFWFGKDDSGRESAHGVVAGQVGSGKSHLLHVVITGLASRYSPDELRFYLVDGKQGVEFEVYRDLPHANVICLRTAPALARSVLADYKQEMDDRYARFLALGVTTLEEYRLRTGETMPRMLMVVDEYQQILDGAPDEGMRLLSPILQKGRAAGMHLLLGSQVFNVQGMSGTDFNDIHLRASLSLAQDYVQTISAFGAEGKRLIRELAPMGEIVINDEAGRDGANQRGAVARLQRNATDAEGSLSLAALVAQISQAGGEQRPIVLNGRNPAILTDNPHVMRHALTPPSPEALQHIARQPVRQGGFGEEAWSRAAHPVGLWLGRRFDVHGHALCQLKRAPAQNLLALGAQTDTRNAMLASALLGLSAMLPLSQLDITLIDGLPPDMPGGQLLRLALEWLGNHGATIAQGSDAEAATLLASFKQANPGRIGLLIISDPENLISLQEGFDPYGQSGTGAAADFREIYTRGAQQGRHLIVASSSVSGLQSVMTPSRDSRHFVHRVVQQLSEDDSMTLFASLNAARLNQHTDHPQAALLVDQVKGIRAATLFHSYALSHDPDPAHDHEAMQALMACLPA